MLIALISMVFTMFAFGSDSIREVIKEPFPYLWEDEKAENPLDIKIYRTVKDEWFINWDNNLEHVAREPDDVHMLQDPVVYFPVDEDIIGYIDEINYITTYEIRAWVYYEDMKRILLQRFYRKDYIPTKRNKYIHDEQAGFEVQNRKRQGSLLSEVSDL